jgi:hypothetical protein
MNLPTDLAFAEECIIDGRRAVRLVCCPECTRNQHPAGKPPLVRRRNRTYQCGCVCHIWEREIVEDGSGEEG